MGKNIYYLFSIADKLFLEVSKELQAKQLFDTFNGLAFAKSEPLNDPIFQNIDNVSDILGAKNNTFEVDVAYLKGIEQKYNIIIADLIHSDRHLMRFDPNKRLYFAQEIIKMIIKGITTNKASFVLSYSLADFSSYFTARYCEVEKIPFLYFVYARLGSNIVFSDRLDTGVLGFEEDLIQNKAAFQDDTSKAKAIDQFVREYVAAKKQPGYVSSASMKYKVLNFADILTTIKYFVGYFSDPDGLHYDRNPFLLPYYRFQRIQRKKAYAKIIQTRWTTVEELKGKKYFIYPLHFHPEAATLIQGRWFNDQIAIIEMLSKAMPADTTLVVKEHRVSIGRRPAEFFERIANFHNIRFVSDRADVYALLENSQGIATISSSMGLEALMLEKPVISFGDIFYNYSNNVYCLKDISTLPQLIEQAVNHSFDRLDMLAVLKAHTDKMIDVGGDTPANFSAEYSSIFVKQIEHVIQSEVPVNGE